MQRNDAEKFAVKSPNNKLAFSENKSKFLSFKILGCITSGNADRGGQVRGS